MRLTKFTHSCIRFDDGDRTLVIDPGSFSEVDEALDGADAVLITHEHPDHFVPDALRKAVAGNSSLRIFAPSSVTATLADLGDAVTAVGAGESFEAAGFPVEGVGGQHALIYPAIPIVANVGYLIDLPGGLVYHPGDSLIVPTKQVGTLFAPLHAPWSKTAEVIDFVVSVRAAQAFQIHDGLLHERAFGIVEGMLGRFAGVHGSAYRHLELREAIDL